MNCIFYSAINASFFGVLMNELILDFDSVTENDNAVSIRATFERITDYSETQYGEKRETYWHLVSLKITHSKLNYYQPTDNDYEDYESEARKLASKEAA
jgi:hypothetical protein